MSVVIRGMGIPKTCGDCPCYEIEEGFCKVTYDDVSCLQISKQGNCPLVELPAQHGRLIDSSAIGLTDFEIVMCDGNYKEALTMLLKKIERAPTVIEAEEVSE